jgi:hypothetical protein
MWVRTLSIFTSPVKEMENQIAERLSAAKSGIKRLDPGYDGSPI